MSSNLFMFIGTKVLGAEQVQRMSRLRTAVRARLGNVTFVASAEPGPLSGSGSSPMHRFHFEGHTVHIYQVGAAYHVIVEGADDSFIGPDSYTSPAE